MIDQVKEGQTSIHTNLATFGKQKSMNKGLPELDVFMFLCEDFSSPEQSPITPIRIRLAHDTRNDTEFEQERTSSSITCDMLSQHSTCMKQISSVRRFRCIDPKPAAVEDVLDEYDVSPVHNTGKGSKRGTLVAIEETNYIPGPKSHPQTINSHSNNNIRGKPKPVTIENVPDEYDVSLVHAAAKGSKRWTLVATEETNYIPGPKSHPQPMNSRSDNHIRGKPKPVTIEDVPDEYDVSLVLATGKGSSRRTLVATEETNHSPWPGCTSHPQTMNSHSNNIKEKPKPVTVEDVPEDFSPEGMPSDSAFSEVSTSSISNVHVSFQSLPPATDRYHTRQQRFRHKHGTNGQFDNNDTLSPEAFPLHSTSSTPHCKTVPFSEPEVPTNNYINTVRPTPETSRPQYTLPPLPTYLSTPIYQDNPGPNDFAYTGAGAGFKPQLRTPNSTFDFLNSYDDNWSVTPTCTDNTGSRRSSFSGVSVVSESHNYSRTAMRFHNNGTVDARHNVNSYNVYKINNSVDNRVDNSQTYAKWEANCSCRTEITKNYNTNYIFIDRLQISSIEALHDLPAIFCKNPDTGTSTQISIGNVEQEVLRNPKKRQSQSSR